MAELFANGARGRLNAGISAAAVSATLRSGQGALFPSFGAGDVAWAVLEQGAAGTPTLREFIQITARSGDTLTIVRAQQGSTAVAFDPGARVELRLTASTLSSFQDSIGFSRRLPMGGVHPEATGTADGFGSIASSPNPSAFSRPTPTLASIGRTQPRLVGLGGRYMANSSTPSQNVLGTAGLAPNLGGMEFLYRFNLEDDDTSSRRIMGISNSNSSSLISVGGSPGTNPSALTGVAMVAMGHDDTAAVGAQWQIFVNAGTGGPVTVVNTGIPKVIGHFHQLRVWSPRGQAKWFVELIDFDAGLRYFGSFTSNIPVCGTVMYPTLMVYRVTATVSVVICAMWVFMW